MADFTSGLLPSGQFGPGAYSEMFTAAEVDERDPRRLPVGATVIPAECADTTDEPEAKPDSFAGQVVLVDAGLSYFQMVQSPFEGTGLDPATAGADVNGCESVTLSLPDGTIVAVTVAPLEIGDVGTANAGLRIDRTAVAADGQAYTSFILIAYVADGARVSSLAVTSLVPNTPADETSFRELVATAFEYQHNALS